jgi:hypothetical protein
MPKEVARYSRLQLQRVFCDSYLPGLELHVSVAYLRNIMSVVAELHTDHDYSSTSCLDIVIHLKAAYGLAAAGLSCGSEDGVNLSTQCWLVTDAKQRIDG